jgi:hypothetical protein
MKSLKKMIKMRRVYFALLATTLAPLAAYAGQNEQPKSNFYARAKLLSRNELSITISHSEAGQKNAFAFAAQHCAKLGKLAVLSSSAPQLADNITTWACVAPPQSPAPALPEPPPAPALPEPPAHE